MRHTVLWILTATVLVFCVTIGLKRAVGGARAQGSAQSYTDPVPNGTHFLARLDDELNTSQHKANRKFTAETIEPLETPNGYILLPGAKIRGHISRIEPAGYTGHARIWLTFDDIDTHHGRSPIIAEVFGVPGDFNVKPGESREGDIEARTSTSNRQIEAAATGAALGAAAGATHGGKAAAEGALAGGIAGFLASSGIGQELDLPKGTKLDLVLDRPLYLRP